MGEDYRTETSGTIGGATVTIRVEGRADGSELISDSILMALQSRADEIKQIVDHDVPPEATEPLTDIDWAVVTADGTPDARETRETDA